MDTTLDTFEKTIRDIEQRQEEDRISLQLNSDKVLQLARDMVTSNIRVDSNIASLKAHYVRKLSSVKM
jgi:hypothetical protein